jgi:pSer/pThr/pTyr-binding forkhead associated (FHA) protein
VTSHICRECQTPYAHGALFCEECGRNLLADQARSKQDHLDIYLHPDGSDSSPQDSGVLARQIEFVILNSGRRVKLPLSGEIRIGRTDPNRNTTPSLDLSDDDGATLGVSRVHASLRSDDSGVILVDLDSTNGTFLYEKCLTAQTPCPLSSGDIFRLGDMQVQVFFET